MELTAEVLQRYVGGQLEIQNSNEGYIYRGEIERAWTEGDNLCVKFKWVAKVGNDGKWHADNNLDYSVSLQITSVFEIGDGIHYRAMHIGEHGMFFPPNGSKLDPSKVIDLELAA